MTSHRVAGRSHTDKKCERCFGKKPQNELFIYYRGMTVCRRCSDAMREEMRKTHPRDEEYTKWLTKHKMKD